MNTHDLILKEAESLGFKKVFFTKPKAFDVKSSGLVSDPLEVCEWTSCVLLLAYPYEPFSAEEVVSAYYLASNESYHKLQRFITALKGLNIRAKRLSLPVKKLAQSANIGIIGKNTLVRLKEYGSRMVLYTVAIDRCEPLEYNEPAPSCGKCTLCAEICPTGAIGKDSDDFTKTKCIRYYMEDAEYPSWVSENINMYMGCERCMQACPFNNKIKNAMPPHEVLYAFDFDRILSGDTDEAIKLVGTNVDPERLMRDAKILKKKKG